TGKKTFGSALVAILASPRLAEDAHTITVRRGGDLPGANIDWIMAGEDNRPSSYFTADKHKHPWPMLEVKASLRGFPLKQLAGLLLATDPGRWDSATEEDFEFMKKPSREELEDERQHHPTRKK